MKSRTSLRYCVSLLSGDELAEELAELSDELLELAEKEQPGDGFCDDRYVRISYATSMELLQTGLGRLRQALQQLQ